MTVIERVKAWWANLRQGDQGEEEAPKDPPLPDPSDVGPQPPED